MSNNKNVVERTPSNQPFNIHGRKNLYKKNAWWQHSPYHRNGNQKHNTNKE